MMDRIIQITQIISTVVSIVALLLIWMQLKYQSKQIKFESLTQLHEELLSPEMQQALRFIHVSKPEELTHPKTEADLEKIESVLNTFDLVGHRVKLALLPKEPTLETEWMILLPIWSKVKPFIDQQREQRCNEHYKEYFEWLVKEAEAFRSKRFPDCEPKSFRWEFVNSNRQESHSPQIASQRIGSTDGGQTNLIVKGVHKKRRPQGKRG